MRILHAVKQATMIGTSIASIAGFGLMSSTAFAAPLTTTQAQANLTASAGPVSTNISTNLTAAQQVHLQNIIAKGNQEIDRRLATLNTLQAKITAATKLTASDKATLSSEVTTTISGLTTLKTQLDANTTVASAILNAKDIYTEYRVYALVAPKISLIKVADDQQVVEGKLFSLATKLQSRITTEQQAGKDVTTLQNDLNDMTSKTSAAQSISNSLEASVITLQPTDYNSNHTVLVGDSTQLKTAHSDNAAAYTDAKTIVSTLKTM